MLPLGNHFDVFFELCSRSEVIGRKKERASRLVASNQSVPELQSHGIVSVNRGGFMKHYLVLCLCLLVSACGGGADGPPEAIDGGRIDQGADSETQDGSIDGGAIDADLPPDEGVDGGLSDADVDAVTDAVVPVDAADPVPVTNCQEACARFSSCGRTDIYADEAQCVAACTCSGATQSLENWFQCLSVESCNLLQLCRLPDPAPLTCEEACNQVDACGGIDGLVCLTACEARNEDNAFFTVRRVTHGRRV